MSKKIIRMVDITSEPTSDVLTWLTNMEKCDFNAVIVSESKTELLEKLVSVAKEKNVLIVLDLLVHVLPTYKVKGKLSKADFINAPKFFSWVKRDYYLKHTPASVKYCMSKLKTYRNIGISNFILKKSYQMDKNLLGAILTQDELNKEYTVYEDTYMSNIVDITRSLYYAVKPEIALIKIMRTIDKPDFTHQTFVHKDEFFVDIIGTHVVFDNQSKYPYKIHSKFPKLDLPFTTTYTTNIPDMNIVDGNIEGVHIVPAKKL